MNKEEFDKKYVGKNIVVNCKTEELANEFLKLADRFGYEWESMRKYAHINNWNNHGENTCYYIFNGNFADERYYKKRNYTIIEYKGENMRQKASEGLLVKVLMEEFGLVEGDKFKYYPMGLDEGYHSPVTIMKNEVLDRSNVKCVEYLISSMLSGTWEIEILPRTKTITIDGKDIEVEESVYNDIKQHLGV